MTAKASDPNRIGSGETILVVEDEAAVRALLRRILERQGYRVVEAASAIDALNLWPQHKENVRLLLTDVTLPEGITGSELAKQLSAEKPTLKVIFTSGYSRESLNPLPGEASNYLQKPYHPRKLIEAVRACLDEK